MKTSILLIPLFCTTCCFGQKQIVFRKGINVLHNLQHHVLTRLQKDFDFSIVYAPWSAWDSSPNYYILAKKGDSLFAFRYHQRIMADIPIEIQDTGLHQVKVAKITLEGLLKTIIKNDLSNLKEETNDSHGCPGDGCQIVDAAHKCFYIINKEGHRYLHYYAPDYYEGCCPGSSARVSISKCAKVFVKTFMYKGAYLE